MNAEVQQKMSKIKKVKETSVELLAKQKKLKELENKHKNLQTANQDNSKKQKVNDADAQETDQDTMTIKNKIAEREGDISALEKEIADVNNSLDTDQQNSEENKSINENIAKIKSPNKAQSAEEESKVKDELTKICKELMKALPDPLSDDIKSACNGNDTQDKMTKVEGVLKILKGSS